MIIRPATKDDVAAAAQIYLDAKEFMKRNGNPTQWAGDYPAGWDVENGIADGTSYVCEDDGEIVATFYYEQNSDDPTYRKIYEGKWKNDLPYSVIHRIAVKYHGRGIIDFCFAECFKRFPNIKIDTHEANIPMKKCLERAGFDYCGIIYLPNGESRIAYQKAAP